MLTSFKDPKNLVTDLYHIGKESLVEFKIPGGFSYGNNGTSMEAERTLRSIIVAKFYYTTTNAPVDIEKTLIIIKVQQGNGKIWSGGQRSEVIAFPTMTSEFNGFYVWTMTGESGDHVDIDPMAQQFTVLLQDTKNNPYIFENPYLLQLSILDN